MASTSKTNWKSGDVGDTKATKPPTEDDRSAGDSSPRTLQKRRSSQSSRAHQSNATQGPHRASQSPTLKRRIERREKQSNSTENPRTHSSQARSKSTSPDGQRGNTHQSPSRKNPDLPPYIRATIAEQLTPAGTRQAREDTKDHLFGQDNGPKKKSSSARCCENTQKTLFGEPEPLTIRKSSRHLADTKHNLFGPPPEVPHRLKTRNLADTPDILSHKLQPKSDLRETQLHAIVGRYVLRYQDTHQKLFGAPEPLRKPPPKLKSNIFYDDPVTSGNKAVKSLPLSSLIVTRDTQLPSPPEISQN